MKIFVPADAAAIACGANAVTAAIANSAKARGVDAQIIRNGSRGLLWLEPMVEVETQEGRIAYGPENFTVLPAIQAEPSAVAVRADSPFKTLGQLVGYLRDHPDKLTVGGFSAAGFHQFVFYRLQQEGNFKADWIPFKGGQEAGLALLGGHIDVAVITPSSALAQIQNGDLRLLAISSAQRDEYFPDIPTFKEQGFDVVETIWRGVMVKAGTPQAVIDVLTAAIEKVKQTREWKDFSRVNLQSSPNISLEDMRKLVAGEISSDRAFLESGGFLKRMN